jgi:hypothetical protein
MAVAALVFTEPATAYETDQFYNRSQPIADSTEVLNRKVNETLEIIIAEWRRGHDEMAFVNAIYDKLGSWYWVDKLERWAINSPEVERLETPRYDSIYSGMPFWSTRATFLFGIGSTMKLNDQLIGSDKIGHFISQGRKFYRRYLRYASEEEAGKHSIFTERVTFGRPMTGSFSNADLVANYEGYRFYRSLFEDGVIAGKSAIVRWENDGWIMQRRFDWSDHVNAYWDEALNVNQFDDLIYKRMRKRLVGLCPHYWENPSLYKVENEDELRERYGHIGLRDTRHLRLDNLCTAERHQGSDSSLAVENHPDPERPAAQQGN